MSDTAPQEPTMEEILASIRRIISEDDVPVEADAVAVEPAPVVVPLVVPVVETVVEPTPSIDEDDDLELTQKVETLGDLDVIEAEVPPPPTLVSETVAAAAAASFGHLSAAIAIPATNRTLEDIVREMLHPMLQQWLDANLPGIVQDAVQTEVDRIARSRLR